MLKIRQAQSILEYAILIAIVIAAVVVMQVYMKRGISGRLKDSSDKISGGESFSASNTTTKRISSQMKDRTIIEMTGTDATSSSIAGTIGYVNSADIQNLNAQGAYSAGSSAGGYTVSNSQSLTDEAAKEAFQANAVTSTYTGKNFDLTQ